MRYLKKNLNKCVTVTLYLQICWNGCFWIKRNQFSVNWKLFHNVNGTLDGMEQLPKATNAQKFKNQKPFQSFATLVPDLDQNWTRLFINALIPCSGTQGTPKIPNTFRYRFTQTDQHTDVCHVVKTLERETVHGPSQIATWSNLLCKRKKVTWASHNQSTSQGPSILFK